MFKCKFQFDIKSWLFGIAFQGFVLAIMIGPISLWILNHKAFKRYENEQAMKMEAEMLARYNNPPTNNQG